VSTGLKAAAGRFILTLSCPDQKGIVAAVAVLLLEQECNIVDSAQFGDAANGRFFMRVCFVAEKPITLEALQRSFSAIGERFEMQWHLYDAAARQRVLLMVSKFGHCLNDLLYRTRIGALPIDIRAIVSNHRDFYQLAASQNIPFHYLPVTPDTKARQEERLLELFQEEQCDLLVLARYMQILSPRLCERLRECAINIHHSFLPSFQGAKPYQQAHDRGVKLIGATAHYVTPDLDEGPIIEQEVARVDHSMSVEDCVGIGRDIECLVLSRAVKWHAEHRILLDGARTIVFR
jgi:formyltetrahydrofolate deformylase